MGQAFPGRRAPGATARGSRSAPQPGPADSARPRPTLGAPRSRPRRALPAAALRLPAAVLVALGASACCLFRPGVDAEALAHAGFRSPERTFHTFLAAWGADLPDLEYRCLSGDFRARNRVSQLTYREFRDRLLDEHPFASWMARAEITESERLSPTRHRIRAEAFGRSFETLLVREDYYEVWSEDELLDDDLGRFRGWVVADPRAGSLDARVPLAAGVDPERVSELRVGVEWKIDDLREGGEAASAQVSP